MDILSLIIGFVIGYILLWPNNIVAKKLIPENYVLPKWIRYIIWIITILLIINIIVVMMTGNIYYR